MTTSTTQTESVTKIPVVDFSKLGEECLKPGTSSWLSLRQEVCHALEELGCFMAIMSKKVISLELHNTMFGTLNNLFDSPIEIKAQNTYENCPFCGHFTHSSVHEGLGIYNPINPEETHKFTHLFWPNGNNQFRDSADLYAKAMAELDQVVTRMVFENYGVEKYHDDHMQSTCYALQFAKYKEPKKAGSDRCGSSQSYRQELYHHTSSKSCQWSGDKYKGWRVDIF